MPHVPSYFDRKQTLWTHEQMMARLKERCPPIRSEAGQPPKAESKLKWGRASIGSTEVRTECGRWRCEKTCYSGKTFYQLSRLQPDGSFERVKEPLPTFQEVKALAQELS